MLFVGLQPVVHQADPLCAGQLHQVPGRSTWKGAKPTNLKFKVRNDGTRRNKFLKRTKGQSDNVFYGGRFTGKIA